MYLFIYLIVKTLRFVQKSSVTTNPGLRSAASKMFGRVTVIESDSVNHENKHE